MSIVLYSAKMRFPPYKIPTLWARGEFPNYQGVAFLFFWLLFFPALSPAALPGPSRLLSSTGSFCWRLNISHPKLSAGGTAGADVSPPYKGSEERRSALHRKPRRRLPAAQRRHPTAPPAPRPPARLSFPRPPQK